MKHIFVVLSILSVCFEYDVSIKNLSYVILLGRSFGITVLLNMHAVNSIISENVACEDKHHNNGHHLTCQCRYRRDVEVQFLPVVKGVGD
jgi:hypothetical protein